MRKTTSPVICKRAPKSRAYLALALALTTARASFAMPEGPAVSGEAAKPTMDAATAEARFNSALRLYKAGKIADALPAFRETADASGSPNARLYVGHCLQQLGQYVEAHHAFTAVVRQITQRGDSKYEPTREAALAQLGLLEPRVAKIVVSMADVPPGLAVKLDTVPIEEKDLGSPVVVGPGSHHIDATATDMAPISRDLTLEAGESKTTVLSFKKADAAAPVASLETAPVQVDSGSSRGRTLRIAGLAAGGVGVAGVAVFTVAGLMAKSTFNRMKDTCGAAGCSNASQLEEIDKGKSQQTIANVGLVVGLVGLSAGTVLYLMGRNQDSAPAANVALTSTGTGAMLSYAGSF